jgi:hypothetical protein
MKWAERYADSLHSIRLYYKGEKRLNTIKEAIEVCEKNRSNILVSSSYEMYRLQCDKLAYSAQQALEGNELPVSGYRYWIRKFCQWVLAVDLLLIVGGFLWLLYFAFTWLI